jgi:hypothetical protein
MKTIYVEQIVNAVIEIVKAIDESRDTTLLINQANKVVNDYVNNQADLKIVLEQLITMKIKEENKELYDKALKLVFDIHRDNITFSNGLNYVINNKL